MATVPTPQIESWALMNPIDPPHYQTESIQCIDVAETMSFNMGNALKYIWRAGKKDPSKTIEDLQKAAWYIEREIKRLKDGDANDAG